MRVAVITSLLLFTLPALAQPDSLHVPSGDTLFTYAIVYDTVEPAEQYKLIGRYAHDPNSIAVSIDHKRGRPSGVYRAWFPDGKPLIFAVYGWGSLHGDWTEYDEFGRITIKGQYRNGQREGPWAFRKLGILGKYKEGVKHGKWKYYENGRLLGIEKYRNGELMPGSTYRFQ